MKLSRITVSRAFTGNANGRNTYSVELDGQHVDYIIAKDAIAARCRARAAFRDTYDNAWNLSQRFAGHFESDEIDLGMFRMGLAK